MGVKPVNTSTQQLLSVLFQRGMKSMSNLSFTCQLNLAIAVLPEEPLILLPVVRLFTLPGKSFVADRNAKSEILRYLTARRYHEAPLVVARVQECLLRVLDWTGNGFC